MARGLQKNFMGSAPGNMAYVQRRIRESHRIEQERRESREDQQLDKICDALRGSGAAQPVQNITININLTPDQVSTITPDRLRELIKIAEDRAKELSN